MLHCHETVPEATGMGSILELLGENMAAIHFPCNVMNGEAAIVNTFPDFIFVEVDVLLHSSSYCHFVQVNTTLIVGENYARSR